jgi:hypothetical protein
MSTPKAALNRRIKISNTGRPYVDVADLVKTRLDRIEKSRVQGQIVDREPHENSEHNDNEPAASNNQNGDNSNLSEQ